MNCDECGGKNAQIFVTNDTDGLKKEHALCKKCAMKKGINVELGKLDISIQKLVGGLLNIGKEIKNSESEVLACKSCGLTFGEFKKIGRFGCSQCYVDFECELEPILRKIHGTIYHRGKHPLYSYDILVEDEIKRIREELNQAVVKEDYERAVVLRDKLKNITGV